MAEPVKVGIIGGSGLDGIEGMSNIKSVGISTPFGKPSDVITIGELAGLRVCFLPRHGRGHYILPTELNNRANIYALKSLGVERIISVSACGSLKESIKPRDFVIPSQLVDKTRQRVSTFFGEGIVAHVGFAQPYCPELCSMLFETGRDLRLDIHKGGVYVCMEGPQFSTRAESMVHRAMGFDIIGMTNVPESKLAREAEICYATVALVTDYDVWKEGEEVTVEAVLGNVSANVDNAKKLIKNVLPKLVKNRTCMCQKALAHAIQTAPEAIDRKCAKKLRLLIGKYIVQA